MGERYDSRSVANLLLDEADRLHIKIKHIALQKLLYFAHGLFLVRTRKPLVSGYFEAWQYGPVHPAVYRSFKHSGSDILTTRATKVDLLTGELSPLEQIQNSEVTILIQQVLGSYGRMSTGRLVDLSHATNSPWAYIVDKARTDVAFGLRISDDVILDRFRYHKMSVGEAPLSGEPSDDTPLA